MLCCIGRFSMSLTPVVFFIGVCLYIGGMKDDLRTTLAERNEGNAAKKQFINAVSFHNELLE